MRSLRLSRSNDYLLLLLVDLHLLFPCFLILLLHLSYLVQFPLFFLSEFIVGGIHNQVFEGALNMELCLDLALVVLDLINDRFLIDARLLLEPFPLMLLVLRLRPEVRPVVLLPLALILSQCLLLQARGQMLVRNQVLTLCWSYISRMPRISCFCLSSDCFLRSLVL